MEKQKEFTVHHLAKQFIDEESTPNIFALVYSKDIAKINGKALKDDDNLDHLEGLVRIKSPKGKPVYKKLRYFQDAGVKSNEVQLDYRTFSILKIQEGDKVTIKSTNRFCYLWNGPEINARYSFRVAVISLIIAVLIPLISFVCRLV